MSKFLTMYAINGNTPLNWLYNKNGHWNAQFGGSLSLCFPDFFYVQSPLITMLNWEISLTTLHLKITIDKKVCIKHFQNIVDYDYLFYVGREVYTYLVNFCTFSMVVTSYIVWFLPHFPFHMSRKITKNKTSRTLRSIRNNFAMVAVFTEPAIFILT